MVISHTSTNYGQVIIVYNLGQNKIGDEGVQLLHKFTTLENLDLNDTKMTGKGMEYLW